MNEFPLSTQPTEYPIEGLLYIYTDNDIYYREALEFTMRTAK